MAGELDRFLPTEEEEELKRLKGFMDPYLTYKNEQGQELMPPVETPELPTPEEQRANDLEMRKVQAEDTSAEADVAKAEIKAVGKQQEVQKAIEKLQGDEVPVNAEHFGTIDNPKNQPTSDPFQGGGFETNQKDAIQDTNDIVGNPYTKKNKATSYQDLLNELQTLQKDKKGDLNKARWVDLASNLGQAFAQYATTKAYGKAGAKTGIYSKDPKLTKTKSNAFERTLAKYKAAMGDVKEKAKLLKTEEKGNLIFPKDPKDPANIAEREKYRQMYPGLPIPDLVTGDDLSVGVKGMIANRRMDEYYKDKIVLGKRNATEREGEHVRKWWNDNQEDIKKTIKEFNKDKVVETTRVKIANIQKVASVLNSKNPIGDASITNFLARASGEVGALTEEDKKPFKGSRAILDSISRIGKEYATGRLTDSDRKYMMDLAEIYEKADLRIIGKRADSMAKQYGNIDFPTDMIRDRFLGEATQQHLPFDYPTKDKPPKHSIERSTKINSDPKIAQYAERYNLDYNKAKMILEKRGYKGK